MLHSFPTHRTQAVAATPTTTATTAKLLRLASVALLFLAFVAPAARAGDQDRLQLNRLVQTSNASDAAIKTFTEGRDLIDEEKWPRAAERFSRFIAEYPSDKNVDAAYYWLAFAFNKQKKFSDADGMLQRLITQYPSSKWRKDAIQLRVQIAPFLNPAIAEQAANDADIEIKIIALQSLCQSEQERCAALVGDVLKSGNRAPLKLREAAISLLGRYGGRDATPVLLNIMRNDPEEKLRVKAISALARTNDESVLDALREQAMRPEFADYGTVDSAMHAIAQSESPRAVGMLGDLAMNAKTLEGRKHAIYLLARRKGEPVVDELLKIYDADQSLDIRKQVVEGLGNRISPRALDKLTQIARGAGNVQLRAQAIRSIANRGRSIPNHNVEEDLNLFIQFYDSEQNDELKDALLETIGQYQTRAAQQKLMEVVRSNSAPIERRKRAINWLSRSKDPEVLRFLEDMLK